MLWLKHWPRLNGLLQRLFDSVWQRQRHDRNALVDQCFCFSRRSLSADVARLNLTVVHLAGFLREAVTHVLRVGHNMTHHL
jgi:hypothetical protein